MCVGGRDGGDCAGVWVIWFFGARVKRGEFGIAVDFSPEFEFSVVVKSHSESSLGAYRCAV